jgi:hypothetical protein
MDAVANTNLSKVITRLEDITLVPTPVTYSRWTGKGREDRIEKQLRADLFRHDTPRQATPR